MNDVRNYSELLTKDLLEQFKGKPNTEALTAALGRQLQEVFAAFADLKEKRNINDAEGAQLDGIGDIVVLPRSKAREWEADQNRGETLSDDRYREYLIYKIFLNTNTCTYKDIITVLKMFWDLTPLYYTETPEEPATMFVRTPVVPPSIDVSKFLSVPAMAIKAGGVRLVIEATTETPMPVATVRGAGVSFGIPSTTLPQYILDHRYEATVRGAGVSFGIPSTTLPQYILDHRYEATVRGAGVSFGVQSTELKQFILDHRYEATVRGAGVSFGAQSTELKQFILDHRYEATVRGAGVSFGVQSTTLPRLITQ